MNYSCFKIYPFGIDNLPKNIIFGKIGARIFLERNDWVVLIISLF